MTTISGDTGITFPDDSIQSKAVSQATPFAITASAIAGAELQLPEATNNGVNYVAVKAPNALAANTTFTLPAADGTNGQFLQTNGSGALAFASVPTTNPGGTTGQLQYNNAGAFGAVSSGTTGQVLTSAGAGNVPTWSNPDAQRFTASGSITAGQPVCLRSDGAVEVATGFTQVETLGAAQVRAGADSTGPKWIIPIPGTSNLIVMINNGATQQVLVASVSGTTITYNTATTAPWAGVARDSIGVAFNPLSNSFIFTYASDLSPGNLLGVVGTVSGTSISFGAVQTLITAGSTTYQTGHSCCYDTLRQQLIICFGTINTSSSNRGVDIMRATISGTTITASGRFTALGGASIFSLEGVNVLYDQTVDRIVVVAGTTAINNVQLVSNSGTAFANVGSAVALGISPVEGGVTFDSVNNKYVAVNVDGSNKPSARTFSITASSITVDAAPTFPTLPESRTVSSATSVNGPKASYDVITQRVVYLFYTNANNIRYITSSGFGASMTFTSYNSTALSNRTPMLAYSSGQSRTIIYVINDSNGANLYSYQPVANVSNTQNFIGLAAASATTGQSLNVTVTGGTNANQTGLVTGASYFLTSLGALTTAGGVRVGEALSATSMFVEGRLNSSGTPSSTTFLRGDGAFAAIASTVTLISSVTLSTSVAEILLNNIPVTSYSSIIIEFMVRPDSSTSIAFGFVTPGGTTDVGQIYGRWTEGRSNNAGGNSFAVNGSSAWSLNPLTTSGSTSEIGAILNVQQTNQTTTKRGFTVQGFGDTSASVGYSSYGGGYSNSSSWGGIRIYPGSGNFLAGSYYRIYGVL